jgi:O-antigen ligase
MIRPAALPELAGPPMGTRAVRPDALALLAAAAFIGAALLLPRLGPNLAMVDAALVVLVATGLVLLRRGQAPPGADALRFLGPWLLVIALATVLSLYSAGIESWALINIIQSIYAFSIFFGAYAVLWTRRDLVPLFALALTVGILMVTISLLLTFESGERPAGTFYHPNYAGHYLVAAAMVCWYSTAWRPLRYVAVAIAAFGVFLTASFGALLMAATFCCYVTWRGVRSRPWLALYALAGIILTLYLGWGPITQAGLDEFAVSDTLNAERLARSETGRLALWEESLESAVVHPLGVGPEGLRNRNLLSQGPIEAHNVYVAYFSERGVLGLVGLLGFGLAL